MDDKMAGIPPFNPRSSTYKATKNLFRTLFVLFLYSIFVQILLNSGAKYILNLFSQVNDLLASKKSNSLARLGC